MRALRYDGRLALAEVPAPRCADGEALIAVSKAGVCATDLEVLRGYRAYAGVLGHEMVGTVVECASEPRWVGQRVVPEINVTCGECSACLAGRSSHCLRRTVMGIAGRPGCFAELVALPVVNLHAVPDDVADDAAVFVEPLAAAYQVAMQVDLDEAESVAVLGDGKLGLLIALALHERGAGVTLLGRHDRKLALAEAVGIPTARSQSQPSGAYDVVVEATGAAGGLSTALGLVRPRGTLVLKSTFAGAVELDTNRIVVDEINVVGSRCGPFAVALEALSRGSVDPRPLIDARYALDDGVLAIEHARRKGSLKVVLEVSPRA